jgi:hypothetical protein
MGRQNFIRVTREITVRVKHQLDRLQRPNVFRAKGTVGLRHLPPTPRLCGHVRALINPFRIALVGIWRLGLSFLIIFR